MPKGIRARGKPKRLLVRPRKQLRSRLARPGLPGNRDPMPGLASPPGLCFEQRDRQAFPSRRENESIHDPGEQLWNIISLAGKRETLPANAGEWNTRAPSRMASRSYLAGCAVKTNESMAKRDRSACRRGWMSQLSIPTGFRAPRTSLSHWICHLGQRTANAQRNGGRLRAVAVIIHVPTSCESVPSRPLVRVGRR
jgi:hypothetical protein